MRRPAAVLGAALAACCLPSAAAATVLMTEDDAVLGSKGYGQPLADIAYAHAGNMGAELMRLHIGRDAVFTWEAKIDPFVNDAFTRGFAPYLALTYSPTGSTKTPLPTPTPAELAAWCTEGATRYAGRVRHYSVWNEPNYARVGNLPAEAYAPLFVACRNAIKAVDPTAKVYYGEIAAGPDSCDYVRDTLPPSARVEADGLAIHTYQWKIPPERRERRECDGIGRLGEWKQLTRELAATGRLRTPAGDPVPLLITEHGYCSPDGECPPNERGHLQRLDEATRADWAARAFAWARRHGVEVFSYYHLVKQAASPTDPGLWDSGIVEQDGTPTPTVLALRRVVGMPPGPSDVNGDGRSDLVTLSSWGHARLHLGRVDGSFGPPQPEVDAATADAIAASVAGPPPWTATAGQPGATGDRTDASLDVNGDRHADVVTARPDGSIAVQIVYPGGLGATTLTPASTLGLSSDALGAGIVLPSDG
jgi:hypothetical protein